MITPFRHANFPGSARAPRAGGGAPAATIFAAPEKVRDGGAPSPAREARALPGSEDSPFAINYSKRRLPHFERPWAKYAVAFATHERLPLTPAERDLVLQSMVHGHEKNQYELYAGCVMPDHVHLLFEPQIKEQDMEGRAVFWSLSKILQGIKSSSAHRINRLRGKEGPVREKESFDRVIRSESDLHEKFAYICKNPWSLGEVGPTADYPWLWTQNRSPMEEPRNAVAENSGSARAPHAGDPESIRGRGVQEKTRKLVSARRRNQHAGARALPGKTAAPPGDSASLLPASAQEAKS